MPRPLRHLLIVCLCLTSLSACRAGPPWKQWMFNGPPPGREYTPLYAEGWRHGCESGASATTNHWYKFHYKFSQDPIKAQNRVYYKGWKDAFDYCQRYIYQYERRPFI